MTEKEHIMNVLLERTLDVDLCRRYRDLRIASVEQFKEEAVILREDKAIVTFLIKEDGKAFLGYVDVMREMQLIPLDDSVVSALITAYGKR
jgi:hypothetical protein